MAAPVLGLLGDSTRADGAAEPNIVGAVVVFRHGARSAIFQLPDGPGAEYETINAPPAHAVRASVRNGKAAHRYAPQGAAGYLTTLGWAQGEALGRRLRRRYGEAVKVVATHSTDTSRTVLTAHAVLTGLLSTSEDAIGRSSEGTDSGDVSASQSRQTTPSIDVIRGATLAMDIGCAELALHLNAGRAHHRSSDAANQRTRAEVARAFGEERYCAARCTLLAVHDDCVARHVHGHPPSPSVDPALCLLASRETAREVRAALRHPPVHGGGPGGLASVSNGYAARLAAGQLLQKVAEHVSACHAAPTGNVDGPRLLLLSGHDTSLLAIANALEHMTADAVSGTPPQPLLSDNEWPPHVACIAFELLSDGTVRVLYQFEELVAQPYDLFLRRVQRLTSSEVQHARWCGEGHGGGDGTTFAWTD